MKKIENIAAMCIETERLLLVPTTEAYLQDMFENFDDEITRFMFPKTPKHINETKERIDSCLPKRQAGEELQMTIVDKTTKEFLGCAGLHKINTKIPELGIWVKKSAHGKKIGREAVTSLEARAQENLDFEYITYPVDKDNIPSRKIAESLNGIVEKDANGDEKIESKSTLDPTRIMNSVMYKIYKK